MLRRIIRFFTREPTGEEIDDRIEERDDLFTKEQVDRKKEMAARGAKNQLKGEIGELFAPLMSEYDVENLEYYDGSVDMVHYGDSEITFIDVKTGSTARLTSNQRNIRDLCAESENFAFDIVRPDISVDSAEDMGKP